jgi:phosphoribosylanthranilate isomerase
LITRIKICCISSNEEADLAVKHGASAIGLVSEMPSGPGVISEVLISRIASTLPPAIGSFLLTSKTDIESILQQQRFTGANTVQLCDRLESGSHRELTSSLPGIKIVQVIHVTGKESVDEARTVATSVDALLLDSGNQSLAVKELGGTGRTHDWSLSKIIREKVNVPVFLAGGLTANNVGDAIRTVQPFGVDVCGGVRTNGKLDKEKLTRFIAEVQHAGKSN